MEGSNVPCLARFKNSSLFLPPRFAVILWEGQGSPFYCLKTMNVFACTYCSSTPKAADEVKTLNW